MLGLALTATFVLWKSLGVQAQTTSVTCAAGYTYLFNTEGQSPCLIAAYLENACEPAGASWDVDALTGNEHYTGPYVENANYCSCSSVTYVLLSACAACQNDEWNGWTLWKTNCTASITTVAQWPLDVPQGTEIPAWAYQNVTAIDSFNITAAQAAKGTGPESSYYGTPTASINPRTSSSSLVAAPTTTNVDPSTSAAPATSGGSKTPVGPIVGGVIGGIAILFLLGLLVFLFLRGRKNRHTANSEMPLVDQQSNAGGMTETESSLPAGYGVGYPSPNGTSNSPQKLYDPSDPSTFPVPGRGETPASFGVISDRSMISHSAPTSTSYPTSQPTMTSSGQYTGAAEV